MFFVKYYYYFNPDSRKIYTQKENLNKKIIWKYMKKIKTSKRRENSFEIINNKKWPRNIPNLDKYQF